MKSRTFCYKQNKGKDQTLAAATRADRPPRGGAMTHVDPVGNDPNCFTFQNRVNVE